MEKTDASSAAAAVADAKISSIFIYPVKSCRGISVPHAALTPTGIPLSFFFHFFKFPTVGLFLFFIFINY